MNHHLPRPSLCKANQATPGTGPYEQEGRLPMRHQLTLEMSPLREEVARVKKITIRERLARLILGRPETLTLVVPGDSVENVTITHKDDDLMALADAVGVTKAGGAA